MLSAVTRIRSLRVNFTRDQAIAIFRPPSPIGLFRTWRCGPLRSIADAYIPFLLHRVTIDNASHRESKLLALDAVAGVLDLYTFPSIPHGDDIAELETRNCLEPALEEHQANGILCEKVRRMVFGGGFFKIRNLRIQAELLPLSFHIPYWVGFSGRGEGTGLAVLDAVRGRLEGSRARSLFTDWLIGIQD
jgi:hypothetical protein